MIRQDYAARIRNLPLMDGTEPVEEEIKKRLEDATGQKVVGVSVPWLPLLQELRNWLQVDSCDSKN